MYNKKSNKDLLILLKKGDMLAFDELYKQYSRRLYGFVIRYLKRQEDAEEIVQEVFFKIWKSRDLINVYNSFDSFLFTIAYNSTISLLRKRANENKYIEHLKSMQQIQEADKLIDELQYKQLDEKVKSLLNELTPRQKEIFELSRYEGLSNKKIAEKLNISINTVKHHLTAALAFLRDRIDMDQVISFLFFSLFLTY